MTQLIDKAALVAEIERKIRTEQGYSSGDAECGYRDCAREILSFIDTLEVKEVDLEKETKKWWKEHLHLDPKNQLWMDAHQSIVFAKHFFELGMSVRNKLQKGEDV